jgi:hypothetical protein
MICVRGFSPIEWELNIQFKYIIRCLSFHNPSSCLSTPLRILLTIVLPLSWYSNVQKYEVISFEGVTYDEYFYNTLNSLLLTVTIFTAYQMLFTYLVYFYHPMSVFHNNDVFEPLYKCLQMVNKLLIKQIIAIMFMKGLYNNLRMLFPLNWKSGYVFLRDKRHLWTTTV